jgi:DNA-cytosine methyltransferase
VKVLDLFSGIGGFSRGLEAAGPFETIAFVEYEPYCQAVLKHHWPRTKILGDIKNVKKDDIPTRPDVIVGGFPCQPFSVAGSRQAQDDPRHLWPDMFRLIQELRPDWVIGENVAGLIHLGLDEVLTDLENAGYTTRTFNIPACAVGAPHQRYRLWIIAHLHSGSEPEPTRPDQQGFDFGDVGNSNHNESSAATIRGINKEDATGTQKGEVSSIELTRTSGSRDNEDVANTDKPRLEGHRKPSEHTTEEGRTDTQRQSSESNIAGDVADTNNTGHRTSQHEVERKGKTHITDRKRRPQSESGGSSANLSDSERLGRETGSADYGNLEGRESSSESDRCDSTRQDETFAEGWWESEPQVGRVAHGIPHRVSQLSSLGNSVVPQIIKEIGLAIMEAERGKKT